ncbi:MAG: M28 family peptidase [Caulobacteraceae bacterium]|nr:M28 family peptidase [Caulobacter sp.]
MIRRAAASLAALAFAAPAVAQTNGPPATPIDPARLSQIDRALSTDAMEGRGPATQAEPKVIDYIVGQMKAAGLQPGGADGAWTQDVPLARFEVTGPVTLSLAAGGKAQALTQGDQAVVQTLVPVNHVDIRNAPLVFCGYGVKAPELGWDDFKGVDLHGKIAVVLINDPDFEAPAGSPVAGKFGGKAETYYGRWTYKYEEAARQGALGMLIVHETAPASYGWNTVKNSNANAQFDIVRDDPTKSHALLQGWIQRDLAVDMFKKAGLNFDAEKRRAMTAGFRPVALKGETFSASYAVNSSRIVSHNILGVLKGSRHPEQTVFYTAHWDHLGVGAPDAKGDRIYNGAVDNADGVASILELARVFARAPRTARSVVFMSVTAEEKGLLGSEYYATHPIYPLAKTAAVFNIDALDTDGPARDFTISGDSKTTLQDDLAAAAARDGRRFTPDPIPEAGHFFRSDHFSFAKAGVPAVSIGSGQDLYAGGVAAGKAWQEDYVKTRYHQPADEWSPSMDWRGVALDLGLIYDVGRTIANESSWPGWKAGSEFRAVREASAAQRAPGA